MGRLFAFIAVIMTYNKSNSQAFWRMEIENN